MTRSPQFFKGNFQIGLLVYLGDRSIQSSLTQVRPDWQRRFLDHISICISDRFQAEHLSKSIQRDTLAPDRGIFPGPIVKAKRILASQSKFGWFFGKIPRQKFLQFQPYMFKAGTERKIDFRIFRSAHLHGIHPSGITRDNLGILLFPRSPSDSWRPAAKPALRTF